MSELSVLRAQLGAYRDFQECVVVDLRWLDWGTSLSVDLDYVWSDEGGVRGTNENRRIVSIRFLGVSDVHIVNDLTNAMVADTASPDWGVGEISCLRLEDAEVPARSRLSVPSYRALFRHERYTWIAITFVRWDLSESLQLPHQSPLNIDE